MQASADSAKLFFSTVRFSGVLTLCVLGLGFFDCDVIPHADLFSIANQKQFVPVAGIAISPPALSYFLTGSPRQLTAVVSPGNATNPNVLWSSADTNLATVDLNGLVTEGPGAVNGATVKITATTVDGDKTAFCNVTFTNVAAPVTGISLDQTTLTIAPSGVTATLNVTINPNNATVQTVTWSTSDNTVVTVAPLTTTADQAVVTLTSGVAGSASITATLTDPGSPGSPFTATCAVSVEIPVASVAIDQSATNLLVGESKGLTATVLPTGATFPTVTWSSSNTTVLNINSVTGAITGSAAGTSVITATADGKAMTRSFTVTAPASVPVLGTPPPSGGSGYTGATMALDPVAQLPVILFRDSGNNGTVSRWLGSSWSLEFSHFNIGAVSISNDLSQNLSIAVDSAGNPYVAYLNGSLLPQVSHWDGFSWNSLGAVLSSTPATYLSLSLGKYHSIFGAGTDIPESPFIGFVSSAVSASQTGISVYDIAATPSPSWVLPQVGGLQLGGPNAASVSLVTNPQYNFAGSSAFEASMINSSGNLQLSTIGGGSPVVAPITSATFLSLAVDSTNTPYLAYKDSLGEAVLVTSDGTNFSAPIGMSVGAADYVSLAIDTRPGENVAYVSFKDLSNGGVASIWKFEKGAASIVIPDASGGVSVDGTKLLINNSGHLFLLYESAGVITLKDFAR